MSGGTQFWPAKLRITLAVVLLSLRPMPYQGVAQAQNEIKHSFIAEPGSPFRMLQDNGSTIVLRNISSKDIVGWGEFCVVRTGKHHKVIALFNFSNSEVPYGGITTDVLASDATPLNQCRLSGGQIAISEVKFADGTKWKSRWNKEPLPVAQTIDK